MIMREIEDMEGFRIGGKVVNNSRYADDTVILAESEQLQQLYFDCLPRESIRIRCKK